MVWMRVTTGDGDHPGPKRPYVWVTLQYFTGDEVRHRATLADTGRRTL
jgi:hypothetical protein